MKKLMIAAATAAMVGGAFADAQVWEMSLTAKTTESKIGTVKSACDACDGATSYRKQATVKIAGVFWGCTCEEMYGLTGPVSANEGVFFWNASKKAAFYDQDAGAYAEIDFGWDILNRIGQKAADCEGVWDLAVGDFVLRGAGFGKVAGCDDAAYIKSMNGSFAGTYIAGNGCKRCEDETASAWLLCDCGEADARTAAYGNWTLKYNASVTKKFRDSSDWSWYKWPGDTLEAIEELIAGPAPSPVDEKVAAFKKADEAWKAAQAKADEAAGAFMDFDSVANNVATYLPDRNPGESKATTDAGKARGDIKWTADDAAVKDGNATAGNVKNYGNLKAVYDKYAIAYENAAGDVQTPFDAYCAAKQKTVAAKVTQIRNLALAATTDAQKTADAKAVSVAEQAEKFALEDLNKVLADGAKFKDATARSKFVNVMADYEKFFAEFNAADIAWEEAKAVDTKSIQGEKAEMTAAEKKAKLDSLEAAGRDAVTAEQDAKTVRDRALADCGSACL